MEVKNYCEMDHRRSLYRCGAFRQGDCYYFDGDSSGCRHSGYSRIWDVGICNSKEAQEAAQ